MNQARIKKNRRCRKCNGIFWRTAAGMRDHEEDHKLAERVAKSGLVLPDMSVVVGQQRK